MSSVLAATRCPRAPYRVEDDGRLVASLVASRFQVVLQQCEVTVLSRQGFGAKASRATAALLLAAVATYAAAQKQQPAISTEWNAPATVSVVSVEKRFSNGSVELSGTLYAPDVTRKVPAMVVLHDASVPSQDAATTPNRQRRRRFCRVRTWLARSVPGPYSP